MSTSKEPGGAGCTEIPQGSRMGCIRCVHPRAHSAFPPGETVWEGTGAGEMYEGAAGIKGSSQGLQGILRVCTALLQLLLILLSAHACPLLCPLFLSFLCRLHQTAPVW